MRCVHIASGPAGPACHSVAITQQNVQITLQKSNNISNSYFRLSTNIINTIVEAIILIYLSSQIPDLIYIYTTVVSCCITAFL